MGFFKRRARKLKMKSELYESELADREGTDPPLYRDTVEENDHPQGVSKLRDNSYTGD